MISALVAQLHEAFEIELAGLHAQDVARAAGPKAILPEGLAQSVNVNLQGAHRRLRRLFAPEQVDESVARHNDVRLQQQDGKEAALLCPSQGGKALLGRHLEGAEDTKLRHLHLTCGCRPGDPDPP